MQTLTFSEIGQVLVIASGSTDEKIQLSFVLPRNRHVEPMPYNATFNISTKRFTGIDEVFQDSETKRV